MNNCVASRNRVIMCVASSCTYPCTWVCKVVMAASRGFTSYWSIMPRDESSWSRGSGYDSPFGGQRNAFRISLLIFLEEFFPHFQLLCRSHLEKRHWFEKHDI